jgi:hypothetical protein
VTDLSVGVEKKKRDLENKQSQNNLIRRSLLKTSLIKNTEELKQLILSLEKDLLAKVIECARKAFRKLLEQIDTLLQKHRPADLIIAHKRSTWYRTYLGPIRVTRRHYKGKDGRYRYLLDEVMGMDKYHHTTVAVKEIACRLAADMPFRRSAEVLNRTASLDLSYRTIHRLVQQTLAASQDEAERAISWFTETGELPQSENRKINRLMIEADGVVLPLQRQSAHKAEVKLGIAYEGWKKIGKDRYSTVNKTYYADTIDANTFWSGMAVKLHQRYDLSTTHHVIGGDGAAWIKEGTAYFGGDYQLCRYHLNRALCHTLGYDRELLRSAQQACAQGNVTAVLTQLKESANKAPGDKAKEIRRLLRYITANASGLKDYRVNIGQHDSMVRRTGAIEGNIDKVIVRRMKNQGMSWSPQGIRRMVWLRINIRQGTLAECLRPRNNNAPLSIPKKRVNRVIDRTLKSNYFGYFNTELPALFGPHASRPWVAMLKSLTRGTI